MELISFLFLLLLLALPAAIIIFFIFVVWLVWYRLAPNNMFFTFVDEGTAKVVVRGKKFVKAIMVWKGRSFDSEWNIIEKETKSFWDFFGGLRWVGIYPFDKVYAYKFRWTTLDHQGKIEVHEQRWQDYVFLQDDYYAFMIEEAEDKNSVPLGFIMVMTSAPSNVYRYLFNAENSLELTIAKIGPAIRDIIGEYSYEEMIGEEIKGKGPDEKFELDKTFMEILKDRKFFEKLDYYGINVKNLQAKELDPPSSYREATLTKRTKEYEAEGIKSLAQAEAARIELIYNEILKKGEDGKFLRMFEAVEKSPLASSMVVVPGLSEKINEVIKKP